MIVARDRQSWGWIVVGDRVLTVVQVLERVGIEVGAGS